MNAPAARELLTLLDDTSRARAVIELSSMLAHQLQRPLELVYVESTPALVAAALPFTRVLAPGATEWTPFAPPDVERGYRAQALRLRELAQSISIRQSVSWSLRVVRGAFEQVAIDLRTKSDLLLVGSASPTLPMAAPHATSRAHRPVVVALTDGTTAGERAVHIAEQVAQALGSAVQVHRCFGPGDTGTLSAVCALVVLPQTLADAARMARLRCPALLVG
jgi:nucleotide-binding universal stress UspA family protein